ncbi:MAG TPA: Gfo/Idh/MocA family oxidoreductase [Steroidobacteraceae bacterium]|nr:Gfo/Idh/MocA family oxidoreductase [Steroidobacteraceae bacterium]
MIRVGIVGCGAVAQQMYARTLPPVANVVVSHVCDRDPAAADELARRLDAQSVSLSEAIQACDAIIVATPPSSHYELCRTSLQAGRTVVCEKPLVGSLAEATDLLESAKSSGGALYVGHFRRMFPVVQEVRKLIATGMLGAVQSISVIEGGRYSWAVQSDYITSDPIGGVLFDTGSHTLDMALFACGLDETVLRTSVTDVWRDRSEPSHELKAKAQVYADSQQIDLEIHLSRYQALANRIRIELQHGRIDVPVGLHNSFRLTGKSNSTVVRVEDGDANYVDCFRMQWESIFGSAPDKTFEARRFLGLTSILEAISRKPQSP